MHVFNQYVILLCIVYFAFLYICMCVIGCVIVYICKKRWYRQYTIYLFIYNYAILFLLKYIKSRFCQLRGPYY